MKSKIVIVFTLLLWMGCSRPVAKYTIIESELVAPATIQIENKSENAEVYSWDFGDGESSSEENPTHTYLLSGQYNIALTASKDNKKNVYSQKVLVTAPEKCLVLLETRYGDMLIELLENTPLHRDNFAKLVSEAFYDSLLFHRVIDGFMIQGGDPNSKGANGQTNIGSGGPGYQIQAEFEPENLHYKGSLAAARQPDSVNPQKKSSGSQFYIVQGIEVTDAVLDNVENRKGIIYTREQREKYKESGGYPLLDMDYTVFGRVIDGLEIIDKIAQVETKRGDRPVENIEMKLTLIK